MYWMSEKLFVRQAHRLRRVSHIVSTPFVFSWMYHNGHE